MARHASPRRAHAASLEASEVSPQRWKPRVRVPSLHACHDECPLGLQERAVGPSCRRAMRTIAGSTSSLRGLLPRSLILGRPRRCESLNAESDEAMVGVTATVEASPSRPTPLRTEPVATFRRQAC